MTNEINREYGEVERCLRRVRPVEPSRELKERVTGAAREVWDTAAADTPWRVVMERLVAAAVMAAIIVSCANYLSNRAIAPWRDGRPVATHVEDYSVDEFPEVSFGPLIRHLAAVYRPDAHKAGGMLAYREKIQETLTETELSGPADTIGPGKGRSRLLPARPGSCYCS